MSRLASGTDVTRYRSERERANIGHDRLRAAYTGISVSCEEDVMTRKYIDCRECPSDVNCSVALSADTEDELMEAAVQHAMSVHQHTDSPELGAALTPLFHVGAPPA
jgi:predicted small metal-binding protein